MIRLDSESERYENIEDSEEFVIFNPKLEVLDETMQGFLGGLSQRSWIERVC